MHYEISVSEKDYKKYVLKKLSNFRYHGSVKNLVHDIVKNKLLSPEETDIFQRKNQLIINISFSVRLFYILRYLPIHSL